jgi:6-phosphogluconolactonase
MIDQLIFVGTYSEPILFGTGQTLQGKGEGIHIFRLDPSSGALAPAGLARGIRNPSYIVSHPSGRFVYCVNELKEYDGKPGGAVTALRVDADSAALTSLNTKASHGSDPCHLVVDAAGRHVLVANYSGGSVSVFPIRADGTLGDASQVIHHTGSGVDPVRQAGPHPHAVILDAANRFAFVPDLGLDRVMIYAFDTVTGNLRPNPAQPWITTAPGAGPRQLAMHPSGRFAYVINELNSTLSAYRYDADRGAFAELQTLSTLPANFVGPNDCAEVAISPSGQFLYGSNRGHDSIAVFEVDSPSGLMSARGHVSTRGRAPRHFALSKDGARLIAANQDSDDLFVFNIDLVTGMPVWTGQQARVGTPVCVHFRD